MRKEAKYYNALIPWMEVMGLEDYDTFTYYSGDNTYSGHRRRAYCSNGRIFYADSKISIDGTELYYLLNGFAGIENIKKVKEVNITMDEIAEKFGYSKDFIRLNITNVEDGQVKIVK